MASFFVGAGEFPGWRGVMRQRLGVAIYHAEEVLKCPADDGLVEAGPAIRPRQPRP
jgi:hypothetical protein